MCSICFTDKNKEAYSDEVETVLATVPSKGGRKITQRFVATLLLSAAGLHSECFVWSYGSCPPLS